MLFFFYFSAHDYNDACLFIRKPQPRQFNFILFNPLQAHFGLADQLMRRISTPATREARGYHHIYSTNQTSATWNQIDIFLQNDDDNHNYPFNRQDLWNYNVTSRRFR